MKKLLALLLSIVMVLSIPLSVSAATCTATFTRVSDSKAYTSWNAVTEAMRYVGNFKVASGGAIDACSSNVGHMAANTTSSVDLNNQTLDVSDVVFFNFTGKNAAQSMGIQTYNFSNGEIILRDKALLSFSMYGAGGERFPNINFTNVKFTIADSASLANFITYTADGNLKHDITPNITFDNCTFDLAGLADSTAFTLFNAGITGSVATIHTNIVVKGGTIKANAAGSTGITLTKLNNSTSSVSFEADANGVLTKLVLPSTASAPDSAIISGGKEASFGSGVTAEGYTTYSVTFPAIDTTYGGISAKAAEYSFVKFMPNTASSTGYSLWSETGYDNWSTLWSTSRYGASKEYVNYMTKDFVQNALYANFSHHAWKNTVDLGGNVFDTNDLSMFNIDMKNAENGGTNFVFNIKNGTVLIGNSSLVTFTHSSENRNNNYTFNFENVTFKVKEDANPEFVLHRLFDSGVTNKITTTINYTNCEIDLTGYSGNNYLFPAGTTTGYNTSTVNVTGCTIKADSLGNMALTNVFNENSNVNFDANTKLVLAESVEVTKEPVKVNNVYNIFANPVTADGVTTYTLTPAQDNELYLKKGVAMAYNVTAGCDMIVAYYHDDTMLLVTPTPITADTNAEIFTSAPEGANTVKVFLWDGIDGDLTPLSQSCDAVIKIITEE